MVMLLLKLRTSDQGHLLSRNNSGQGHLLSRRPNDSDQGHFLSRMTLIKVMYCHV